MRHRCWNATRTCWNSWKPVAKSGSKDSRIESYGPLGVQSRVAVARGRWNSPDCQFEVLNTSLEPEGADAEFEAFWSLFEQRPNRRALNWKLRVRLMRVVELGYDDLERLGVGPADYGAREYSRTQEVSDGVNYLGCDGLIVPSARYDCRNLVVYMQNLEGDCFLEEVDSRQFRWSD